MLCENCKKNEANTTLTKNINGHVTIQHLCAECAAKKFSFRKARANITMMQSALIMCMKAALSGAAFVHLSVYFYIP